MDDVGVADAFADVLADSRVTLLSNGGSWMAIADGLDFTGESHSSSSSNDSPSWLAFSPCLGSGTPPR